jgi:phage terminase large subunit
MTATALETAKIIHLRRHPRSQSPEGRVFQVPGVFSFLREPARYKVAYGGRGSGKSHSIATLLIHAASHGEERILCCREFQTSLADSVHQLLRDKIEALGLLPWFRITREGITCPSRGSYFRFIGLRNNPASARGAEGVTKVWLEEGQRISKESLRHLIPTVMRTPKSEVWISMNAENEIDPVYQDYIVNPPPGAIVRKVNWDQNPFFPESLDIERRHLLSVDPQAYQHVWEGDCLSISDAIIFRHRVSVESFMTPDNPEEYGGRFYFGADFGFANDPSTLIRCFIKDQCLWIDQEWFGYNTEIDDMPAAYDDVPGARRWPIKADSSRPETISFLRRKGFNIDAAEKWQGSVEDGIAHLKGFKRIIVHERCPRIAQEFRLYKYKVDPRTEDVLPIVVDAHNHGIDALRYALDGFIQQRGAAEMWARWGEGLY